MSQLSAVDLFRQAMAASRAGDKVKTRECLLEAVKIDPNSETTWQWLAGVAESPLEATRAWEKVLQLNPNSDKAKQSIRPMRLQAGIDACKAKDVPTARRLLRSVVADEPKNEHGWLWLASVSDTAAEAKAHLERVLYLNPNSKAAKKGIEYYDGKIAKLNSASSTIELPKLPPRDTLADLAHPPEADDEPAALANRRHPGEPGKALVVDGSRTYRKLIGMTVAIDGFTLIEAEDAHEAIDRIRDDGVPDIIVLDSKISGLDSFEFCKLLRQHPDTERVPVVLLHGGGPIDKARGKSVGLTAVLSKPIHPETLLDVARRFCPISAK